MLDLLTEKEMENEDLAQKLENYKMEAKIENDKNLEKIRNLEDKIELLESEKGGTLYDIDDVVNEYNKSKEKFKKQINELTQNEEDMKAKLDMKDRTIQKLNDEIQKLEIEKLKLINQNNQKEQLKDKEIFEIEQLKAENDKLKRENSFLEEQLKLEKENLGKIKTSHQNEIENIQKQIEVEQNNTKTIKEEKLNEINTLKAEITKINKNLSIFTKKAEIAEKRVDDEQQKSFMIQNKLDRKTKELQELNEYTKKLLANKDNLISQYEEKIEEITKDKNDLLTQNKQLLENIKLKKEGTGTEGENTNTNSSKENNENGDDNLQHSAVENKLLKEEIKGLKEQIDCQAKDLVDLNSFEKEIVKLKAQNESLEKENKSLKKQIEDNNKSRLSLGEEKQFSKYYRQYSMRKESMEGPMTQNTLQKKLDVLKKMKEDEKKEFETQLEKINLELAEIKVKKVNLEYENDALRVKYNNFIKSVTNQCKKNGITLNINSS